MSMVSLTVALRHTHGFGGTSCNSLQDTTRHMCVKRLAHCRADRRTEKESGTAEHNGTTAEHDG